MHYAISDDNVFKIFNVVKTFFRFFDILRNSNEFETEHIITNRYINLQHGKKLAFLLHHDKRK